MTPSEITPVILTYNEAPNLERCLATLGWAAEIIVLDSGSTDETQQIATAHKNVRWLQRDFDDHTSQWNHAVAEAQTPWVLSLDADYLTPEDFVDEVMHLSDEPTAWFGSFRYLIHGRALSASLYPPRALLFRRDSCEYVQDGHTQLLKISKGASGALKCVFAHDDRKPLQRWIASQFRYATLEAEKLGAADYNSLRMQDKLRKMIFFAAPLTLIYTLVVKRAVLDGWRGMYYTTQRVLAEVMLALCLLERRILRK
jgi:glycosyltransferase involved in cell wall biosynthesis